jgi:hypothetical protein
MGPEDIQRERDSYRSGNMLQLLSSNYDVGRCELSILISVSRLDSSIGLQEKVNTEGNMSDERRREG